MLTMFTTGTGYTVVVIPELTDEHDTALVTLTVTRLPLASVVVV